MTPRIRSDTSEEAMIRSRQNICGEAARAGVDARCVVEGMKSELGRTRVKPASIFSPIIMGSRYSRQTIIEQEHV